MSGISTHVLNIATGQPARGVRVTLERSTAGAWVSIGEGVTDANGRVASLLTDGAPVAAGDYRMRFFVGDYFGSQEHFHPEITVQFRVNDAGAHYHVPLLVSPYGYTTYRGS